jgi:serine protease Do
MRFRLAILCSLILATSVFAEEPKKTREQKVREDREKVEKVGYWIYNDLAKGFAEAKQSGKPMLVILRCLPCEECVKLDDDLMDNDPELKPLFDKFVRVRVVGTNGLDLSLFQFDTDQSFTAFLLNADGTIYGRFGTRSHRTEWVGDVSLPGMSRALEGALELHKNYPANKASLAAKRGPQPEYASPELYPALKEKYTSTLNYSGNVVQSCIHCHQIGDAQRDQLRLKGKAMPEQVLFPYPHPKAIGLILDPKQRATVVEVTADSAAAKSGLQAGDRIESLSGQPILSLADVQWVLHHADAAGATIPAKVQRSGKSVSLDLKLSTGWRQQDNIAWRSSSWGLRRMATGGFFSTEMTPEERQGAGIPETGMALKIKHVGQYAPHDAAKQAGLMNGDIVVGFDGRTDLIRESDLLAYGVTKHFPGDKIKVNILRNGQPMELTVTIRQ